MEGATATQEEALPPRRTDLDRRFQKELKLVIERSVLRVAKRYGYTPLETKIALQQMKFK